MGSKLKKIIKIAVDVAMFIIFLTLYDKTFISQRFHEIAGITLIVLIIFHLILNFKMTAASIKNFTKIKLLNKISIIVDILLLVCFLWLGLSGVASQKTLFPPIVSDSSFFKFFHKFGAAVTFVILSIHIGMHVKLPKLNKIIATIFAICIFLGGVWGVSQTKLAHFFSIPAIVASNQNNSAKNDTSENWTHREGFKKQHRAQNQTPLSRAKFLLQYFLISASIVIIIQVIIKNCLTRN